MTDLLAASPIAISGNVTLSLTETDGIIVASVDGVGATARLLPVPISVGKVG